MTKYLLRLMVATALFTSFAASAQPTVSGNTISWSGPGWYQVQNSSTYMSLCQGGTSCVVPDGTYIVINHSTGQRWEDVDVPSGDAGTGPRNAGTGPRIEPTVGTQAQRREAQRVNQDYDFELVLNSDFDAMSGFSAFGTNTIGKFNGQDIWYANTLTEQPFASDHQRPSGAPPGVRDLAWHNKSLDKVLQIWNDGPSEVLVQRGHVIGQSSPEFDNYFADGVSRTFNQATSWINTYKTTFNSDWDKISDLSRPAVTFGKNTFFEIMVNFESMSAPGFRHSFWLMPATSNVPDRGAVVHSDNGTFLDGTAYNGRANAADGVEIDIYEHERHPSDVASDRKLLMKVISSNDADGSGNTNNEIGADTDVVVPGINSGWHKIGLLWAEDKLVWFVDGQAVVRDSVLMPNDARMYMILSREINDVLYGQDPTLDLSAFSSDVVKIKYVKVWRALPQGTTGTPNEGNANAPGNFRGFVASRTAAELMWNRTEDSSHGGAATSYRIVQDGLVDRTTTNGSSLWMATGLTPGATHSFTIQAIYSDGAESAIVGPISITMYP